MKCAKCGHDMIWGSDADFQDVYGEECEEQGIFTFWTCPHCGSEFNERTDFSTGNSMHKG